MAAILAGLVAACADGLSDRIPEIPAVRATEFSDRARQLASDRIEALAGDPDDPWANGDLAAILHAHGHLQDAAVLYERAAALSGGDFRWSYLLGVTRQEMGAHGRAASSFRDALAKRAYAPAAILLGESLAADGLLEDALVPLREAVTLEGGSAAAAYELGRVLLDLGEPAKAIAELERAVSLAPGSGAARYALAMAYRAEGEEGKAASYLRTLGDGGNDKPPLEDPVLARVKELGADEHHFLNLGRSLSARGRTAEAIRAYEKALALEPNMAAAHANLVGAYGQAGDAERARKHYELAVSIDSGIEEIHNNWGVLQATAGNPAAAASAFRRALEVNPDSSMALANLGMALAALGDREGAIRRFEQAVANDPGNGPARMNLGVAALEEGRLAEAIEHLESALAVSGAAGHAFVRYTLGKAYALAGRQAEAREQWQSALRIAKSEGSEELVGRIRDSLDSLSAR